MNVRLLEVSPKLRRRRIVVDRGLALHVLASLALAVTAACGAGGDSEPTEAATTPSSSLDLVAENISFDTETLVVKASRETTVRFENKDAGVLHNLAVYRAPSAREAIFKGELITGGNATSYTFEAPAPGTYFFRCDVHPDQMTGSLVVR